jgi:ubiquinone/menaquinone biosynthesis C-methylase UbiE
VDSSHYRTGYDKRERWSSYWIQIEQAMKFGPGPFLEIGVGTGLVTDYLRKMTGANVTTVDIDPKLHPDVVADIVELPFNESAFECAMACEVLEHMPFEQTQIALKELRRVARNAIISVPNSGYCAQVELTVGPHRILRQFDMSWYRRRTLVKVTGQHYWELEIQEYPKSRFVEAIKSAGWRVVEDIRNPEFLFHEYFILK